MIRLIPPVAVPYGPFAPLAALAGGGARGAQTFAAALGRATGAPQVELHCSGRAALESFLAARRRDGRDEVLVPAYTCWSVAAAVVRAGMRVRLLDLDPLTLGLAADALDRARLERCAALIVGRLFAGTEDVAAIAAQVRRRDASIAVVDDCAQHWPSAADWSRHRLPTLLSFARGKPLPLGGGGALLLDSDEPGRAPASPGRGWADALKLAASTVLARPGLFRAAAALPFLRVGVTIYDPDFALGGALHGWQERLGLRMLDELPRWIERRTAHARRLVGAIEEASGWTIPAPARATGPIRLPVLAPDAETRRRVIAALRRRGVAASGMYPGALGDIPALAPHIVDAGAQTPGARRIADTLFTLPVHPSLSEAAVERIAAAFRAAAAESA